MRDANRARGGLCLECVLCLTYLLAVAGQFNGSDDAKLPGQNRLATACAVTHLAYISDCEMFGDHLVGELILAPADAELAFTTKKVTRDRHRAKPLTQFEDAEHLNARRESDLTHFARTSSSTLAILLCRWHGLCKTEFVGNVPT